MLPITIPDRPAYEVECFDNATGEFRIVKHELMKGATVQLEHSLLSISKWESKWKKSFLGAKQMSMEETISYVQCMTIGTPPSNPKIYENLSKENLEAIYAYINDSMTATWFRDDKVKRPSRKIITSELIYSWMIDCEIPFSCERWHINRLFTLIRVRREEMKNENGGKKMKRKDQAAQTKSLNAARRAKMGSRG